MILYDNKFIEKNPQYHANHNFQLVEAWKKFKQKIAWLEVGCISLTKVQ